MCDTADWFSALCHEVEPPAITHHPPYWSHEAVQLVSVVGWDVVQHIEQAKHIDDGSCRAMKFRPSHSHRLSPVNLHPLIASGAEDGTSGAASSGAPPVSPSDGSNHPSNRFMFAAGVPKGKKVSHIWGHFKVEESLDPEPPLKSQGRGYQPWISAGAGFQRRAWKPSAAHSLLCRAPHPWGDRCGFFRRYGLAKWNSW